jgi:hypothetical protein
MGGPGNTLAKEAARKIWVTSNYKAGRCDRHGNPVKIGGRAQPIGTAK